MRGDNSQERHPSRVSFRRPFYQPGVFAADSSLKQLNLTAAGATNGSNRTPTGCPDMDSVIPRTKPHGTRTRMAAVRIVRSTPNGNGGRRWPLSSGRWERARIKREAVEGLHHLPHRSSKETYGPISELLASPNPLLAAGTLVRRRLGGGGIPGCPRTVGPPVPAGAVAGAGTAARSSSPGRDAGFLFNPRLEEAVEVRPHRG